MAKIVLKTIPSNNGVVNTLISIAQLSDLTARELEGSDIPVTDSFQWELQIIISALSVTIGSKLLFN